MNRKNRKMAAFAIIGIIVFTADTQYIQAASGASAKEEVVYANLNGSGALRGTYVVNIFDEKNITDYGNYSQVKNLNTTDVIHYKDGVVSIAGSADRLYYQGDLQNAELPWNIAITYSLDGAAYPAEKVAGKSGKLVIRIAITENTKAKEGFFANYALQATVKLDSSKCKNIETEDATQASIGSIRQLTYTIMPGKTKDIVITSDVRDFIMEGIQLNGIRLNLGIDSSFIDSSPIDDKIGGLKDAVYELKDGVSDLKTGAAGLKGGAAGLEEGMETVQAALNTLNGKSGTLTGGSAGVLDALMRIQKSLQAVNTSAEDINTLSTASAKIRSGIDSLAEGLKSMDSSIDAYYAGLLDAGLTDTGVFINKHKEAIAALSITDTQRALYEAYIAGGESGIQKKLGELAENQDTEAAALYKKAMEGDREAVTAYIAAAGKLITAEALLKADISYIQGSGRLIGGIDTALDRTSGGLMAGALTLQSNYAAFDESIQKLVSSLGNLAANMTRLKNGIDELTSEYEAFNGGILKYTKAVGDIAKGYGKIYEGALQMAGGTADLYNGTKAMADGTEEFAAKASGMENEINTEIDQMINEYTGSDYTAKSFVSDENTRINSVQFNIKAPAIKVKEAESAAAAEQKPLSLWQKFLKLFGLL